MCRRHRQTPERKPRPTHRTETTRGAGPNLCRKTENRTAVQTKLDVRPAHGTAYARQPGRHRTTSQTNGRKLNAGLDCSGRLRTRSMGPEFMGRVRTSARSTVSPSRLYHAIRKGAMSEETGRPCTSTLSTVAPTGPSRSHAAMAATRSGDP